MDSCPSGPLPGRTLLIGFSAFFIFFTRCFFISLPDDNDEHRPLGRSFLAGHQSCRPPANRRIPNSRQSSNDSCLLLPKMRLLPRQHSTTAGHTLSSASTSAVTTDAGNAFSNELSVSVLYTCNKLFRPKKMKISKWVFVILTVSLLKLQSSYGDSELSQEFLKFAKKTEVFDWMVGVRRTIHENPELGYQEFETSKFIREELDKLGISYKHPIAVTGVVGYIGSGEPPFVALRADTDALSMQEMVEWEHKSKVAGKMHACGHDSHVTMLLQAVKILKNHSHLLKGTVVLNFWFSNQRQKAVTPLGQVISKSDALLAGSGVFQAVTTGKGGHAAIPQHSIDPILAASNVVVSLQHIVSREADPLDSQVVKVAKFHGGGAFNVILDSVTIGGTF